MEILIPNSDEELLQECEVQTMRSQGTGGQGVNTTDSAVRLVHIPSGIMVKCQKTRSQFQNKAIALQILRHKLEQLNKKVVPRIPTRISRAAKNRNLDSKKKHSKLKKLRSKKESYDG